MKLPLGVILGEVLVLGSGRYYDDLVQDRQERRHELFSAILHPALACIGDDVGCSIGYTLLEYLFGLSFKLHYLLGQGWGYLLLGVERTCWTDEAGAQDGVIPVENDDCFVELWLVLWGQPHSVVSELGQKLPAHVVGGSLGLDEVQRYAFGLV